VGHGRASGKHYHCGNEGQGKLISESLIETKSQTLIDFLKGLSGEAQVTFEE
jgi:hypothetical protein